MGATTDSLGVWLILYRLRILRNWAEAEFRPWVDEHVLGWAESNINTASSQGRVPIDEDEEEEDDDVFTDWGSAALSVAPSWRYHDEHGLAFW